MEKDIGVQRRITLNICMVTHVFLPVIGGAELHVYELANSLARKGNTVHIVAPSYGFKSTALNGVKIHRVNEFPVSLPPVIRRALLFIIRYIFGCYIGFGLFMKTLQLTREEHIQVIHAHYAIPAGFIGALVSKLAKKPLVITMHAADIQVDRSIGYGYRLRPFADRQLKLALSRARFLIAVSENLGETAIEAGASPPKIRVIPSGVNINKFSSSGSGEIIRKKLGINHSPVVLYLGRLHPKKGLQHLIMASKEVLRIFPNVKFIICGDGPERSNLERLAEDLQVHRSIIFTGAIPEQDKPLYYAIATVFAMPSIIEGLPLALLEALASGLPVITTPVGGITEVIKNGENGILIEPRSYTHLAHAIARLLSDEKLRNQLSKNARETAEKYSWDTLTDKVSELYSRALSSKR